MLQGVLGGVDPASRSDQAVGFGAVFAGCLLLTFGAHMPIQEHDLKAMVADLGEVLLIRVLDSLTDNQHFPTT